MADLKNVYTFGLDLQTDFKYATTNLVTADNTLIDKIKSILATLGLYNPTADSAARKLIPILSSKAFDREYKQLGDVEKDIVYMAVQNVLRRTSSEERPSLKGAAANFLTTYKLEQDRKSLKKPESQSANIGKIEEDPAAVEAAQAQNAKNKKSSRSPELNQKENAITLCGELKKTAKSPEEIKTTNSLLDTMRFFNPKTQMETMISHLEKNNCSHLLDIVLQGELTKEQLLSGAKHLATVISKRSQIK